MGWVFVGLLHLFYVEVQVVQLNQIFVSSNNLRNCYIKFQFWVGLVLIIWYSIFFVFHGSLVTGIYISCFNVCVGVFSLVFEVSGLIMCGRFTYFSSLFNINGMGIMVYIRLSVMYVRL